MARGGTDATARKAWLKREQAAGRRRAMPAIGLGLGATASGLGQAWCAAAALAAGLDGVADRPALIGFAVLAVVRAGIGVLAERAASGAGAAARRRLRSDAMGKLLAAGPAVLGGRHSAETAAVVVDQIEALDGFYARWMPAASLALAAPALVALAVLAVDWPAGLILLAAGLLVPVGMAASGIGAAAASRKQFLALGRLQARFLDRVRGIATIVMLGRAKAEETALAEAARELRQRTMRVLRVAFLSSVVLDCAAAAALVTLALRYAGGYAQGQSLHPAAVALFVLLAVPEFFAPLRAFSAAYQDRIHAQTAAEALAALPPMPAAAPPLEVRTIEAGGATVAFEAVSYRWDPSRPPALDAVSFRVPAGETLILVGPSGAGKTTVIEILLGFIRPEAGRVTINGMDIVDLTAPALARLSAWVGQRPVLFAGSIFDNIRFARPEATPEEVAEAARAARVTDYAAALPQGLETLIGEGGWGISGGQAQRIAIARAFLRNAPLLLLDEPTAHLDPTTESEVLASLRRLAIGRTVILASHAAAAQQYGGPVGTRRIDLKAGQVVPSSARGAA
jgi:ATP-binding cassette subfamily C protein CydD